MSGYALEYILNPYDAPAFYYDTLALPIAVTTPEGQPEQDTPNTHNTTVQGPTEKHLLEGEDAEAAIDDETYFDLAPHEIAFLEHIDENLEDYASASLHERYATTGFADQQGTRSASTQAALYNDGDDDDDDVFYDASDVSPLDNHYETQAHDNATYYTRTVEDWVLDSAQGEQRRSEGQLGSPHANRYEVQATPSRTNNFPSRHDHVTYYAETAEGGVPANGEDDQRTCEEDLSSRRTYSDLLFSSESDWEISSISESESDDTDTDTDTDTTDDESDAGILPVVSALSSTTRNTTEAVSARQFTTRGPLNYGSDEPVLEGLGSDGELADDEDEEDGSSDPESEVDDYHNTIQHADNNEEEDEDDAPSTPQWDPATFVYVGELTFAEQWPLLPLPMNETNYPEEELADDEKDLPINETRYGEEELEEDENDFPINETSCAGEELADDEKDPESTSDSADSTEDVKEEIEAEGNTGVSPPAPVPELGHPPNRIEEVKHLLAYRFHELAGRKVGGRGGTCNDTQEVRGKRRGSDDEDEEDERA